MFWLMQITYCYDTVELPLHRCEIDWLVSVTAIMFDSSF